MGSEATKNWGAEGRVEILRIAPEKLIIPGEGALHDAESDALPVDEAMVNNIMVLGVIEPVIIRRNGRHPDGSFKAEVVAGRTRVRAAVEANKRLVAAGQAPLLIEAKWRLDDDAQLALLMVSENAHRRVMSPLEKARKMAHLRAHGQDDDLIRNVLGGVSKQSLRNWEALLECAPVVQKAVEAGKASCAFAVELAKLPREAQAGKLTELLAKGATRGAKGKKAAAKAARGGAPPLRTTMRGAREVRRLLKLTEGDARYAKVTATSVLLWVLGDEDALPGHIRRALDADAA